MDNQIHGHFSNQAGYIMVEFLVVTVIMGLLLAAAIPAFGAMADQAAILKIRVDLQIIDTAISYYATTVGALPENFSVEVLAAQGFFRDMPQPPTKLFGYSLVTGTYEIDRELNRAYVQLMVNGMATRFYSKSSLPTKKETLLSNQSN